MESLERHPNPYFETAKELASWVARETDRIELERKLPNELAQTLADKKFFRLLVPRSLGGEEMDLLEYLRIIEIFAKIDASTAWCLNQNNVFATFSAKMTESTAQEIWNNPRAIVTNGPPTSVHADLVEGGYQLTGYWTFSSGSPHATWVAAVAPVENPHSDATLQQDKKEARYMLIPRNQVEFVDDWNVSGLRGTGSLSFKTNDLFIPFLRTFSVSDKPREPGALYVFPINVLFASGFATIALWVARTALDTAIELASKKKQRMDKDVLQDKSTIQREVGQAEATWGSAKAFLHENISAVWESAQNHHTLTVEERIRLRLAATHAIRMSAEVVDLAYSLCGSNAIFANNPIQRCFQDIHAITQQLQGRMSHYDTAGQFFLGLEPQGIFW